MIRCRSLSVLICLVLCLFLCACTTLKLGRDFDKALGGLARDHVEYLGGPEKRHALVKLRFSGEYEVISASNWVLRLGEEYTHVRTVEQFTDRGTDYAILACTRADGTLQNVLLVMPDQDSRMVSYNLLGDPNRPFSIDIGKSPAQIMQAMDSPNTVRVWWLDNGLRGPKVVSMAERKPVSRKQRQKMQEKANPVPAKAPVVSAPYISLPPPVNPTAVVRMGESGDLGGREAPTSSQAKPVLVLDP